jgi:hypothetical protein
VAEIATNFDFVNHCSADIFASDIPVLLASVSEDMLKS